MTAAATKPEAQDPTPPSGRLADRIEWIPLERLIESDLNPRKHYESVALRELADSLKTSGQLTPILVRPHLAGRLELAAGHRRYRAAKLAGLTELLAIIRPMDQKTFMEVLTIENLQRDDLRPLEEARGFADLQKHAGYDVAKIAVRIGRSTSYVYDRLALLDLIPDAKQLLEDGRIEAGHAILIARESSKDQARILGSVSANRWAEPSGGLFQNENVTGELALGDRRKARSVRELACWINDHIRQTPETTDPVLFPETAKVLQAAATEDDRIVHITYDHQLKYDAKDHKVRTFGNRSWKRADGQEKSKTCEHSVVGYVVAGKDRGA
jgi:ParB/RepB/Spo0J family partition protein